MANCLNHKKFIDRYTSLCDNFINIDVVALDWSHGRSKLLEVNDFTTIYKIPKPNIRSFMDRWKIWVSLFRILFVIKFLKRSKFDLLIVNSFEMFLFACIFNIKATIKINDVADLHPIISSDRKISNALNLLEGWLSNGWVYMLTSPWFYWSFYLNRMKFKGTPYLIENKISTANFRKFSPKNSNNVITIIWNGILRCDLSASILASILMQANGRVRLLLAGVMDQLSPYSKKILLENKNVTYIGTYDDENLFDIIRDADYSWASDLSGDLNSRLLLPNRIYQAVYFELPLISFGDTAITKVIKHFGIGLYSLNFNEEEISNFLKILTSTNVDNFREKFFGIKDNVVRGDELSLLFHGKGRKIPLRENFDLIFS